MSFEVIFKLAVEVEDPNVDSTAVISDRVRRTAEGIQFLRSLAHPNLVKVSDIRTREGEAEVVVIEESITAQSLETLIRNNENRPLPEDQIRRYCKQICQALAYLHSESNRFISRNISSSAVKITDDGTVKLVVDYDMTIQLQPLQGVSSIRRSETPRGFPHYMAPELLSIDENCKYSRESDIWAFGCLIYEMATGGRPNADCRNLTALGEKIKGNGAPALPRTCSSDLRSFYAACAATDRRARKSAAELLSHKFLAE